MSYTRTLFAVCSVLAMAYAGPSEGRMFRASTLADLTDAAARVFRGHCVSAEEATLHVAGARIPVTTYTFTVSEHLKGNGGRTLTFRQVGTRAGGPRDLGRWAGLPVYAAGGEYVLFLLPAREAGLTSPAGAAEGAFVVVDDQVRRLGLRPATSGTAFRAAGGGAGEAAVSGEEHLSYAALRRAVRERVGP